MGNSIVILGAGKIGRGFVADIFHDAGYELIFADSDKDLVGALNKRGRYTLYNIADPDEQEKKIISGFSAMETGDAILADTIQAAGLAAVSVFRDSFADVARMIGSVIQKKNREKDATALDIIVLANISRPQTLLREAIYDLLTEEEKEYADEHLGIAGTIVQRIAVKPSAEMLEEDSLAILTDGYKYLPVEDSFRGNRPESANLVFCENLDIREMRKLYTYNMAHVAAAYYGFSKGFRHISDAMNDPDIEALVRGALDEICRAFSREYGETDGFGEADMSAHADAVIRKFKNPLLKDTPERVGANPVRKLQRTDRLIGAALMARRNGIYPYFLTKAAAYGYLYADENDQESLRIRRQIASEGIEAAIREVSGLDERDMVYHIASHYKTASGKFVAEDMDRAAFIKKAYEFGFSSEKMYRGCAQGTLLALTRFTGIRNESVFKAASGFSGGMGISGDGVCGGYAGGILFMSLLRGRSLDSMIENGDKENQYMSYETAQMLRDRYLACYGSLICKDIHEGMFHGEHFILRTKERRDEFEKAGAHAFVCTSVVGLACAWVVDILLEKGILTLQ